MKSIEDKLKRELRANEEELLSLEVKIKVVECSDEFYKDRINLLKNNINFIKTAFVANGVSLN